jgi:hypothetical protein
MCKALRNYTSETCIIPGNENVTCQSVEEDGEVGFCNSCQNNPNSVYYIPITTKEYLELAKQYKAELARLDAEKQYGAFI